jgi:hypothetical protein
MNRDGTSPHPSARGPLPSSCDAPPRTRPQDGFWLPRALALVLGAALCIGAAPARAQTIGIEFPIVRWQFARPGPSEFVDLNVLYEPATSERIRQAMLVPWTSDERLERSWLAKIAAGQVPADHRKLLAIQGLQTTNMADVATAYLIEAIDVLRGYRVTVEERIALQKQLALSVLDNARWRSSDFRAKQETAERLAYATLFIREMAEQAVQRADPALAEGLKARTHRQVLEVFRIDLMRVRIDRNEGLRAR